MLTSAARKNAAASFPLFYLRKERGKNITVIMYLLLKHLGRESA